MPEDLRQRNVDVPTTGGLPDLPPTRRYRRRVGYVVGSVFLLWHTTAILLGPWPASYWRAQVYAPFQNYLTLFFGENMWAFFAPGAIFGQLVRYEVETPSGSFSGDLTRNLPHRDPNYFRMTAMWDKASSNYAGYERSYARHLCAALAHLQPTKLRFVGFSLKSLPPRLYLEGRRPLDDDMLKRSERPWYDCSTGEQITQ